MSSAATPVELEELEESTESYLRTELLDRIAHELRGPAGVTLGALDEIERLLSSHETEETRALLLMARRGARRILRTAERLTRTAHLEGGPVGFTKTPLDVRDLVKHAVREASQIEGRNVIRVDVDMGDTPCMARADADWLSAALEEVFSQAIRCARRRIQIKVQINAGLVQVSVEDDRAMKVEIPSARFLSLRDKRDCALGWPMASDVARAHEGELTLQAVVDDEERVVGARAVLSLRSS